MKTTIKMLIATLLIAISTTGCAVKKNDHVAMKTIKHTANTPIYAVLVVGAIGVKVTELALVGTVGAVSYLGTKTYESIENLNVSTEKVANKLIKK